MSKLAFTVLAATAALAVANGALAGGPASSRVYYGDLDLSTQKDAKLMLKRIRASAGALCAPIRSPVIFPPERPADNARCKAEALQQAVARLQAPVVTAEYDKIQAHPSLLAVNH